MARAIPEEIGHGVRNGCLLGAQLLEIVTSGMYSDPRMAIREYVQNAADSLDTAEKLGLLERGTGTIDIRLDGRQRSISVLDNGVGVGNPNVARTLRSVGISRKERTQHRGFRGIGRLGGLAYCDRVVFETRSEDDDLVGVVTWDGEAMTGLVDGSGRPTSLARAVQRASHLCLRNPGPGDASHFFRATMYGVRAFHRDQLMNPPDMIRYISQVAPVPFCPTRFSFHAEVDRHLSGIDGYRSYDIRVNGEPAFRLASDIFPVATSGVRL